MGSWWSSEGGSSSKPAPPNGITQISNVVYSFSKPSGRPEMEIVFIHGLHISDYEEAYWKTWVPDEKDENDMEKMVEKLMVINNELGRLNDEFERIEREQYAKKRQFAVIAETLKTGSHGFSAWWHPHSMDLNGSWAVKADHFGV